MARQMKDSGIEWIGEIPACWELRPARYAFSEVKEKNVEGLETRALQFKFGKIIAKTNFNAEDDDYIADTITNYTIVEPGTVMINGLNLNYDFKTQRAALVTEKGVITSAYLALRPDEQLINAEYATYLFKGYESKMALHNMGAGIRLTLGYREFKNQPILFPSLGEQQQIVGFLDRKCAEIDTVIEKTKETIEEYKKLKQSVITEAVTKGIRGNRSMKGSRIEWLDSVPSDWTECRIKNVIFPQEKPITESDEVITCFRDGEVTLRKNRREDGFTISFTEHGYHGVDIGDLVIHGMDAFAGAIGCSDSRGKTTPVVHVCNTAGNNRYFMYFLQSMAYGDILMDLSNGVRIRSSDYRNFAKLGVFGIVVPPIDEQNEIVDFLDKRCAELDTLIAKKTALLTELETYKKSLVYEYVTGKTECIDVQVQEQAPIVYPSFPAAINTDKPRFAQAVLMSKILDSNVKQMGRVKLEKMLYTIETSIGFDFDTEYAREAAGPLHSSIYECEGIIGHKNKWFTMKQSQYGVSYTPTSSKDKYKKYYDKYFSEYATEIDRIISVFRDYTMDQAEIVATLFAAWNDAIIGQKHFTDEDIVDDVLNNWHESKKRFPRDVWLRAMEQMRKNDLVPKGYGKRTVIKTTEV